MSTDSTAPSPRAHPDAATYVEIQQSEEFGRLRSALRGFAFPVTAAFLVWYALYVLLSAFARDFMSIKVVGNINVALVFGLLQFVSTFVIAWAYARFAGRRLDPIADSIRERIEGGAVATAPAAEPPGPVAVSDPVPDEEPEVTADGDDDEGKETRA